VTSNLPSNPLLVGDFLNTYNLGKLKHSVIPAAVVEAMVNLMGKDKINKPAVSNGRANIFLEAVPAGIDSSPAPGTL